MFFSAAPVLFFGILSWLIGLASADTDTSPASVFILSLDNNDQNYTFAVNIPEDSEDVYFHLSGPADYSWIAVGTGTEMKDSLMVLLYSSASGNNVTVSPRLASGESEPAFASSLDVTLLPGTGMVDNTMTVNARCSNCARWDTGSLDLKSTSQSWIFALGPRSGSSAMLQSDSQSASIERHSEYGQFNIDMVHATGGSGGLPASFTTAVGSSQVGSTNTDSNWPSILHALAACAAFIFLMPTGVVFLRVIPSSVRWHWVNQSLASALAIIGGLLGIYVSTMFTKSQSFNSPHQILGILLVIAVVAQWFLGFWHHRLYKRTQSPSQYGLIHRYFGHVIILLAVINGGVGLTWSYAAGRVVIAYSIVVALIGVGLIFVVLRRMWNTRKEGRRSFSRVPEFAQQQSGYESDVYLTSYPETR